VLKKSAYAAIPHPPFFVSAVATFEADRCRDRIAADTCIAFDAELVYAKAA